MWGHFTATIKTRYLVGFVLLIFVVFCVQLCFFALFCLSSSCVFVCTVLPVSLYCPFLIAPSGFSKVYIRDKSEIFASDQ